MPFIWCHRSALKMLHKMLFFKEIKLLYSTQDSLTNRANQISGVSVSYLDTHLSSSIPARFRAEEDSRLLNAYKQQ